MWNARHGLVSLIRPRLLLNNWSGSSWPDIGQYSQVSSIILPVNNIRKDKSNVLPIFYSLLTPTTSRPSQDSSQDERNKTFQVWDCTRIIFCHNFYIQQLTKIFQKKRLLNLKHDLLVDSQWKEATGMVHATAQRECSALE